MENKLNSFDRTRCFSPGSTETNGKRKGRQLKNFLMINPTPALRKLKFTLRGQNSTRRSSFGNRLSKLH
ncbi:UNVERIFIED_CONTAM: hypothetical protein NCL1_16196 [Trichonephila clavipes]